MDSLLLDFADVGRLITFSQATIANWAYRRKPAPQGFPAPIKVGRILRYRRIDIERWIDNLRGGGVVSACVLGAASAEPLRRPRGRPRKISGGEK